MYTGPVFRPAISAWRWLVLSCEGHLADASQAPTDPPRRARARRLLQTFGVGKIFGGLLVEQGYKLLACCGCSHFVCADNLLRRQFPPV
jgi:hypothetical protein